MNYLQYIEEEIIWKKCVDLQSSTRLSSFQFVKYDTLDNSYRTRVEEAMIDMMEINKFAPNKIEKNITINFFNKLNKRWE